MLKRIFAAAALLSLLGLTACGGGGSSSSSSTPAPSPASTSKMLITVGDAPLSSVLSARVTVSSVTLGSSSNLLPQPQTIELTSLGGIREPLELASVATGTYSSASVTVSAAEIEYVDPATNTVKDVPATLASPTATLTLNPALAISSTGSAVNLHLDFNLAKSLDLTNGAVTFTPVISAAAASIDSEQEADRDVHASGIVTAVSSSSLTLKTPAGNTVTVAINSQTKFEDSLTLAAIQVNAAVRVEGLMQSDGSILATDVSAANGGAALDSNHDGSGEGMVVAVTRDSNGTVTDLQLALRDGFDGTGVGRVVTVHLSPNSNIHLSGDAADAGMTSFDVTQIFPGQMIWLSANVQTDLSLDATEVKPAALMPTGTLAAAVSGTAPNFSFPLALDSTGLLTVLDKISSLAVVTNSQTLYTSPLSASTFAGTAVGAPLAVRGFLQLQNGQYTLLASHVEAGPATN